jgi:hypothetical protein
VTPLASSCSTQTPERLTSSSWAPTDGAVGGGLGRGQSRNVFYVARTGRSSLCLGMLAEQASSIKNARPVPLRAQSPMDLGPPVSRVRDAALASVIDLRGGSRLRTARRSRV